MGMIHTGIFNKEIVSEALRRSAIVRDTPVVLISGERLADNIMTDFNNWVETVFKNWIDSEAIKAGLPTPEKDKDGDVIHYGFLATGEFTKWDGKS